MTVHTTGSPIRALSALRGTGKGPQKESQQRSCPRVPTTTGLTFISILPVLQPMLFTFSYVNAVIYCTWEKQNVVLLTESRST
ncbi:hypothetical protein HOLleu_30225 [Holothuria leucospilota]|uniref:Uncharacterized protein n=1 Tax=Holothuria leucospilota TaxID=206669 RepID=A0A9Q1BK28_HOLLE|nr:hypothetical protein HOLleu_30225 [Holothuria leucospilota]